MCCTITSVVKDGVSPEETSLCLRECWEAPVAGVGDHPVALCDESTVGEVDNSCDTCALSAGSSALLGH